jgi:hypothetical protein
MNINALPKDVIIYIFEKIHYNIDMIRNIKLTCKKWNLLLSGKLLDKIILGLDTNVHTRTFILGDQLCIKNWNMLNNINMQHGKCTAVYMYNNSYVYSKLITNWIFNKKHGEQTLYIINSETNESYLVYTAQWDNNRKIKESGLNRK